MRMKSFGLLIVAVLAVVAAPLLPAQQQQPVRITKAAQDESKPSLRLGAISGDEATVKALRSYLKACGWFKIVDTGYAEFTVSGQAQPNQIVLDLSRGNNKVWSRTVYSNNGDGKALAATAVDQLLLDRFKAQICRSQIAFCAEFTPGLKSIVVCDIDGGNARKITNFSTSCVEPDWMPNGNSLLYTRYYASGTDICQTMLKPWQTRRIASYQGTNVGASVHPGGEFLALVTSLDHQVELYVKSFNRSDRRRLTNSKAVEASPCWSPDGGKICFVSDETKRPQLYVIGANGGSATRLPTVGTDAVTPDWSKSNRIVYAAKVNGNYTLAIYDMNRVKSGVIENLPKGNWESPSWAPDNRHIVAVRKNGKKGELFVVDSETGEARRLLNITASQSSPAWSGILQ